MTLPAKNSAKARDTEMLLAVAQGSRTALGELYLIHHKRLVRFLSRFTSSYENVEEIVNDTFLAVWQSAKDFRFESQVSTWIISIAYRTFMKTLRKHRAQQNADALGAYPDKSVDPTIATEIEDWLRHGLSQLPVEQRLTLELAFHMGHSLQEIAVITDCPVSTVKARLFHSREKLRQSLPTLGGEAPDLLQEGK